MKNNYILIGDSITYGIGDYENNGWASMFKNYIINKDDTITCNNFVHIVGFPGATSSSIECKIDDILKIYKYDDCNNIIILAIGINDTQVFYDKFKVNINTYVNNLKSIILKVKKYNCKIITIGLTGIGNIKEIEFKPNKYYKTDCIIKYDEELKNLSTENNIQYISMKDVLYKDDFVDGLHPNTTGHKKIFEKVKRYI